MYRYLLFKGNDYYPEGGWKDLHGMFSTIEEVEAEIKTFPTQPYEGADWWHVVDLQIMSVVDKGEAVR